MTQSGVSPYSRHFTTCQVLSLPPLTGMTQSCPELVVRARSATSRNCRSRAAHSISRLVRVLGERKQKTVPPPEFWHSPSKEMFLEIAKKSAGRIAGWVMPRTRDRARIALPNIRILPLDDAPGDAKISLVQAVSYYLKRRRVKVVTSLEAADLTVGVQITVSTLTDQRETVRITWTVLDDENKIIGTVDQENSVESGRLNKPWREIAGAVGEGAAEGIAGLAKEFAQSRVKSGNSP